MLGSNGDTDIENRLADTGSEVEGTGETNGENSLEVYTLTSVKQITNGNLLYDSGNTNQGSVIT